MVFLVYLMFAVFCITVFGSMLLFTIIDALFPYPETPNPPAGSGALRVQ